MARSETAQEAACWNAPAGHRTVFRVKVLGPSATWYDLTDFLGEDWLDGASYADDLEAAAQATVSLRREINGKSLAPLITTSQANTLSGSYDPLIRAGRSFVIEAAILPLGIAAVNGDFREVFRGKIDSVDDSSEVMKFVGRDGSGAIQDIFIETANDFATSGEDVEVVMGEILDDWGVSSSILHVPVSPSWVLQAPGFRQQREPLLDALRTLAIQRAWFLQYRWIDSAGAFKLAFFDPDRTKTVPDWTFTADQYEEISSHQTSIHSIRNRVEVIWSDRSDLDSAGQPTRKSVIREDATSKSLYGTRYCSLGEADTSQIDTEAEAERLCEAVLLELKDIKLEVTFKCDYRFGLQLGDLVRLQGNGVHHSGDQDLAIVALDHDLGAAQTTVTVRGKPGLGAGVWLSREQRPNVAVVSDLSLPPAVLSPVASSIRGGLAVEFTPDTTGRQAALYHLHVSASSGFTPDTSDTSTTFRCASAATRFEIDDLSAGTTYYAKVVPQAHDGTFGPASAEVSQLITYTAPRDLLPVAGWTINPPNSGFESFSSGTSFPPDCWSVTGAGVWGTDIRASTTAHSGGRSVEVDDNVSLTLSSQMVEAHAGEQYIVQTYYRQDAVVVGGGAYLIAEFFNAAGVSLSHGGCYVELNTDSGHLNTWQRAHAIGTAPAGAVRVTVNAAFGYSLATCLIDSMRIDPWDIPQRAFTQVVLLSSWTTVSGYPMPQYQLHSDGRVWFRGAMQRASSSNTAVAFNLPAGYRPKYLTYLILGRTKAGTAQAYLKIDTNGDVTPIDYDPAFQSLDGLSFSTET